MFFTVSRYKCKMALLQWLRELTNPKFPYHWSWIPYQNPSTCGVHKCSSRPRTLSQRQHAHTKISSELQFYVHIRYIFLFRSPIFILPKCFSKIIFSPIFHLIRYLAMLWATILYNNVCICEVQIVIMVFSVVIKIYVFLSLFNRIPVMESCLCDIMHVLLILHMLLWYMHFRKLFWNKLIYH